jgi:S1-C subfamily serine protease
MRLSNRILAAALGAALLLPALAASAVMAQDIAGLHQTIAQGPMTAWCEPGQALLSGGYELQGAEPFVPEETPEGEAPAEPPIVFVAASHPTYRFDGSGAIAQFGWTAVPNTLAGEAGPLSAYVVCAGEPLATPPGELTPPPPRSRPAPELPAVGTDALSPVEVVEHVGPAVVTVINEQVDEEGVEVVPTGAGSGFFLDTEGHIVTNAHVVVNGTEFIVILSDGREFPATLVGMDENSDVAVLKFDGPVPAVAPLGDSESLLPGQAVLAIGSPLRTYTNTVTQGIVSALGRIEPNAGVEGGPELLNLIQHDAAINPGNSGGPLVTLSGEVVGINTLGRFEAQGLFFAVPAETIRRVANELIAEGAVDYPYLGLLLVPLDDQTISRWGLAVDGGAYVQGVVPGTPAEAAGVQVGDILTAVNLEPVGAQQSVVGPLFEYKPGDRIQLSIQRGLVSMRVQLELTERPADP